MMGVTYKKDACNPLYIGLALRAGLALKPSIVSHSRPSNPIRSRRATITEKDTKSCPSPTRRDTDSRFVRVQGSSFEVPTSFFSRMPTEVQQIVLASTDNGMLPNNPIELAGHTANSFKHLLLAHNEYPNLDIRRLSIDQIFNVSELSFKYHLKELKTWSINAMASILNSASTPLRTASNQVFVRALHLAFAYRRIDLSTSIQVKWLTRLHWHELSPIPAIIVADKFELRNLLGHALYTHLVDVEANITNFHDFMKADSPLTRRQRTYLLAGYYSLPAYWKQLQISAPPFKSSPQCGMHKQCLAAWKMRWSVACDRPCSISKVDVFKRLRFVEQILREDMLLQVCLSPECRIAVLDSISKKRTEIANTLHHHFDLT